MIKNLKYSKELLSELLNLDRKELYILEQKDKNLYDCITTGLVVLMEQSKEEDIPFSDLSYQLNKQPKNFEERDEWVYKNVSEEIIANGKIVIELYGLNYKDINEYIYFRNLKKNVLDKFYEDLEDRTNLSRDLFFKTNQAK